MTCEPMHSAQTQSRKVKESRNKYLLDWLVTIVVTSQEMRLNVLPSVVQLLLTYGPFYKNVTTSVPRRQNDV